MEPTRRPTPRGASRGRRRKGCDGGAASSTACTSACARRVQQGCVPSIGPPQPGPPVQVIYFSRGRDGGPVGARVSVVGVGADRRVIIPACPSSIPVTGVRATPRRTASYSYVSPRAFRAAWSRAPSSPRQLPSTDRKVVKIEGGSAFDILPAVRSSRVRTAPATDPEAARGREATKPGFPDGRPSPGLRDHDHPAGRTRKKDLHFRVVP